MTNNKNKFDWHNYRFALGLLIAIIVFILSYYQINIITIIHSLYKNKVVRYYLTISYIIIIIFLLKYKNKNLVKLTELKLRK